jgi:hypothetical protein
MKTPLTLLLVLLALASSVFAAEANFKFILTDDQGRSALEW